MPTRSDHAAVALKLLPLLFGQRWPHEQIRAFQNRQLRALVAHAWAHHAHYAGWWREAGLSPSGIRGIDDIQRLPFVNKAMLQPFSQPDPGPRMFSVKTSGSTGQPLRVTRTHQEDWILRMLRLSALHSYGMNWRGDRRIAFGTGAEFKPSGPESPLTPWWMKLGLLEYYRVDYALPPEAALARLRQLRPTILGGLAGVLHRISLQIPASDLHALKLKFVTGGAEPVTPDMKRRIEQQFNCPMYVTYGSIEFNLLASECPKTGVFHLNEHGALVEVLNNGCPAADGENGEVFVTGLHSFAMPFIRYAIGDWVVAGPSTCPCGAPVRTIRQIQGRTLDLFYLPGGRRIHPLVLANPLFEFSGWRGEYRFIQERIDLIRVPFTFIPGVQPPDDAAQHISAAISAVAGEGAGIVAEPVERLDPNTAVKNVLFQTRVRV